MVSNTGGCRSDSNHIVVRIQVTYDKLETKNLFSPHFGECRYGRIELTQDPGSDLMIGCDAANYEVCPPPSCTGLLGLLHEALHSVLRVLRCTAAWWGAVAIRVSLPCIQHMSEAPHRPDC